MKKYLTLWFPVIIWCSVIFFFSSLQTNIINAPFDLQDFIIKKTAHIVEFFILAILVFRALTQTFKNNFNKTSYVTFIISFIYAMSDEFHQRFTYGRTSRVRDVIIDGVGILLALYFINKLKNDKKFLDKLKFKNKLRKLIFN